MAAWDELTVALETYLAARAALISRLRIDPLDVDTDRAVTEEQDALRAFVVKMTERATSMAANAANGIIHKYLDDVTAMQQRITQLEERGG